MRGLDPRAGLRPDCGRCVALCCVALAFCRSADFAFDKAAGTPCRNLSDDFRCAIHGRLAESGLSGCVAFGCFGAGQHVTEITFASRDWRRDGRVAASMFAVFDTVRDLKEIVWHLLGAQDLGLEGDLGANVERALATTEAVIASPADDLERFDVLAFRHHVGGLLEEVSRAVHSRIGGAGPDHRDADLVGASFRGAMLRGADLRGARLVGADLSGADLSFADLLGADLRAADVRGATLATSLFLTQPQLDAAIGDQSTTLSGVLSRPAHWPRATDASA